MEILREYCEIVSTLSTFAATLFALLNRSGCCGFYRLYGDKSAESSVGWRCCFVDGVGTYAAVSADGHAILNFFGITLDSFAWLAHFAVADRHSYRHR